MGLQYSGILKIKMLFGDAGANCNIEKKYARDALVFAFHWSNASLRYISNMLLVFKVNTIVVIDLLC
jgi:hypothetical protein